MESMMRREWRPPACLQRPDMSNLRSGRRNRSMAVATLLAAPVMATLGAASFSFGQATATAPVTAPSSAPSPAPSPVIAVGTVEAYWSADLYAKTSGYVSEVKADIGDAVKKGQVLAVIDVPEADIEVVAARAGVAAQEETAKAAAAAVEQSRTALEVAKRQSAGARS